MPALCRRGIGTRRLAPSSRPTGRCRILLRSIQDDRGQATVEFALLLPLVVVLLLAVAQVVAVARDAVAVEVATRAAGREAAIDPRPAEVKAAAQRASPLLKAERLTTETSHRRQEGLVSVEVRYRAATDIPIVGRLAPDITLESKATFRRELGQ